MNIKSTKLALGIILVLGIMQVSSVQAAGNSLNRLDVRKSQTDSSVEVLLYTADPYGDNVAVTKKSDNRYVILMPNLSGNGASKPDLSGISDIVSNVDVSSVNDSGHGYTKITLTTTKPVNVKTRLQKSMPVTAEQQAYRDLIAKSRAMTSTPSYIPEAQPQKKEQAKPAETKTQTQVQAVTKPAEKTDVKKVDVKKAVEEVKKVSEKTSEKKVPLKDKKADAVTSTALPVQNKPEVDVQQPSNIIKEVEQKPVDIQPENVSETAPVQVTEDNIDVVPASVPHKSKSIPFSWFMIMLPLAGLFILTKFIAQAAAVSRASKSSFIDNIADMPSESKAEVQYNNQSLTRGRADDTDVMNDDTMNWQEKYQHYVSASDKDAEFRQKAIVAANTGSISIVNNSSQDISDVVKQMKKPAKKLNNSVTEGKAGELRPVSRAKSQAAPVEIVEPIEIVEPPAPNPAKQMKKTKKVAPKKPVQKPVQKVVNNNVNNEEVKKLEQRIEKLEAERELKEKEIKELQAAKPKNDFEKHADKKKQEVKVMENKKNEEEYLVNLEELLHKSPDVEKTNLNEDIILQEITNNFMDIKVHKEDDIIANNMINSVSSISLPKKLKAFENKIALEESDRKNPLPKSKLEQSYQKANESRHVNLGYSSLNSPARVLEGGNLRVGDLIAKSGKFLKNPVTQPVVEQKVQPEKVASSAAKDYSMATIEEFFAMDEVKKPSAVPSGSLSDKVAQSLAQVKPSMNIKKAVPAKENITNPISQLKSETKDKYINGLIVKSGFNIDKNRGFYIVNLDGENALIGRVKEEIFVLKKFDRAPEKPLQVRQDNGNVYMVKADGFRSLVEVSDDRMGVLIEL